MPVVYIREDTSLPERAKNDFYQTDPGTVTRALFWLRGHIGLPAVVLDPGAGTGIWGLAYQQFCPGACVTGVEIDTQFPRAYCDSPVAGCYDFWHYADFLAWRHEGTPFGLVLGNPPYKEAEAFVRQSLALTPTGGHVFFLLKLSFLASQKRKNGLFAEHPPRCVAICSKRPSFLPSGKTAPDEYAMFLWQKGYDGRTQVSYL